MAPVQKGLALLVFFGTALKAVYGCTCYVGQEPDTATGKPYGWSLAEQRPCECTEFRLGGVNMKPQIKPHEVKIGDGNRLTINEQGHITQSPKCREDETTFEGTSICAQNTPWLEVGSTMELQLIMMSPMRLEFTVGFSDSEHMYVTFSPDGPGTNRALYQVYLGPALGAIHKRKYLSKPWTSVQSKSDVNYIGVPVMITYVNDRFEVAVKGVKESTLTCDVTSPPQSSWFVSFYTDSGEAKLSFTEPCIN